MCHSLQQQQQQLEDLLSISAAAAADAIGSRAKKEGESLWLQACLSRAAKLSSTFTYAAAAAAQSATFTWCLAPTHYCVMSI